MHGSDICTLSRLPGALNATQGCPEGHYERGQTNWSFHCSPPSTTQKGKLPSMPPRSNTKLGAKWQLDAALLSRPVDLTALVSLSQTSPDDFYEDDTLARMVKLLLNAESDKKADKDTRLDVLTILSNLAASSEGKRRDDIREALDGVNDFMEQYLEKES